MLEKLDFLECKIKSNAQGELFIMTSKHLRCVHVEAARCSRLQCRFWACFLLTACVCLFLACIAMPTSFSYSAVLPTWRHGGDLHRRASFLDPVSHDLLPMAREVGSEEGSAVLSRRLWSSSRKLLTSDLDTRAGHRVNGSTTSEGRANGTSSREFQVQRMGPGVDEGGRPSSCSVEDIAIVQGEMGPMPDGIPSFAVQILNLCLEGCPIADIHVSCGWFASATLVNPALFKRVSFDDCLVKDGRALAAGETLTFQYANSFQYPFSLSSASFTCP